MQTLTDLHQQIQQLDDGIIKQLFGQLVKNLAEKDKKLEELEERVCSLESRVQLQERYSSKDSLIFENVPLINDKNCRLEDQMCSFLACFLDFKTEPANFKACHFLSPWKSNKYPPAVIIKFVYFGDKMEVFKRKAWLARNPNKFNNKPILIKERLSKTDNDIKNYADGKGLVTTTWNSQVRVFRYGPNGIAQSVGVDSFKSVDDLHDKAVKKATSQVSSFNNVQQVSSQTGGRKMNASKVDKTDWSELLKCLRESPDERSIQFLKSVTDSAYCGNLSSLLSSAIRDTHCSSND